MRLIWIGLLLVVTQSISNGTPATQEPILLSDARVIEVTQEFQYVADQNGTIQLKDLIQDNSAFSFQPEHGKAWNKDINTYWLQFSVVNKTGFDREWIFDFENWAFVDFYYQSNGEYILKRTGHLSPFSERVYPIANNNYINIPVRNGEVVQCLVRLKSQLLIAKIPVNLNFKIAPRDLIDQEEARSSKIVFSFLGALVIMFLYNSFIYFSTGLRAYGYYLLGLFFVIFHTAGNAGYIFSLFGYFDSFPNWFYNFNLISSNLWGVTYILFIQDLLKIKDRYPAWNKVLNILIYLLLFAAIVICINFEVGFAFTQVLGLASIIMALWLCIKSILDRYPSALYLLIGNTALLLGIFTIILTLIGIFPKNKFTYNYALPTGSIIEILFYSIALANMINILRKENEVKQKRIIVQLEENQQLQFKVNKELEHKVYERTKELEASLTNLEKAQKQLVQKEKMASLGELTAGIAHEIQNPLNFVTNYSDVSRELLEELIQENQKKESERDKNLESEIISNLDGNLLKIQTHGKRADSIVKSMAQLSRRTIGEKSPTNLNDLTDEYLRIAYHEFTAGNPLFDVELITDYDPNIGTVELVSLNIGRVLVNIFNNAFYAVQQKSQSRGADYQPRIRVSTYLLNDNVELRIKDNGTGISQDIMEKIYQPFFTTKPAGIGTGMGLSLSYDIINNEHGGEITVKTEVGNFTEFVISLPHKKEHIVSDT